MRTMEEGKRPKRARRSFTDDFKAGAVRLVLDEGKTVMKVARDLDLTASALRQWVERPAPIAARARPGSPARSARSWRGWPPAKQRDHCERHHQPDRWPVERSHREHAPGRGQGATEPRPCQVEREEHGGPA